jgi:lactate racemase
MRVNLAYGRGSLPVDLPDWADVTVLAPSYTPGLPDARAALRQALAAPIGAAPLREQIRPGARVGIVFSDITRAMPHEVVLPAVLDELALAGVRQHDIVLFEALGTHRRNSDSELIAMLGEELVRCYPIVQNDAFDPATQTCLGVSRRGHEIWVNSEFLACDLKILTGFIEPHMFAGFSGGGKAIMPGMAGQRTVLGNHDAGMLAHPQATWGIIEGNPVYEEIVEVAQRAGAAGPAGAAPGAGSLFLVNVTTNRDRQVTGVFAGDLEQAHAAGCAFVKASAMTPVARPFDIVITSNSGYPLDQSLYQSVKGMSAAAQVVKCGVGATRGGIIIAAECADGIPDHGLYRSLLAEAGSPEAILEAVWRPGYLQQDQWQVQIQAQVQLKADVYVRADGLTSRQIEDALLRPCARIEVTLAELLRRYGPDATICVLPEGPLTIPYVAEPAPALA